MSGNSAYDRTPRGFFKNLSGRTDRLERRLPPEVIAASGLTAPTVNEHVPITVQSTPPNTVSGSWWGSGVHVDYITFTAEASGVLDNETLLQIRQYPYAIYDHGDVGTGEAWGTDREFFYGINGLMVYIYKGGTVDQDYPGLGTAGDDNDSPYVYFGLDYWQGDSEFTVTAGDTLTVALVWWDSWRDVEVGETLKADVGGLTFAINAALGGVDLTGQSWRSTVYPDDYVPSFEVGPTGYYKADAFGLGAKGEGSHAEGLGTFATGYGAHAEGQGSQAHEFAAHAEGWGNIAGGQAAHAEGRYNRATGQWAHTEGEETQASGRGSHAEGYQSTATQQYAHAEGADTTASASSAHSEGAYTEAAAAGSHAEGLRTVAHRFNEHARGSAWASDNLLFASRLTGVYPANQTGSGYMQRPFGLVAQGGIFLNQGRLTRMEIIVLGIAANETVGASWRIVGLGYYPTSGSARFIGTPTVTKEFGDAGTAAWSVSIAVQTNGEIRVTTNSSGTSARWSGVYHFTEVPFDDLHW